MRSVGEKVPAAVSSSALPLCGFAGNVFSDEALLERSAVAERNLSGDKRELYIPVVVHSHKIGALPFFD